MGKKLVRKALEMLRKLATGDKGDDEEKEEDKEEKDSSSDVKGKDNSDPYIKFFEEVSVRTFLLLPRTRNPLCSFEPSLN